MHISLPLNRTSCLSHNIVHRVYERSDVLPDLSDFKPSQDMYLRFRRGNTEDITKQSSFLFCTRCGAFTDHYADEGRLS